MPFVIAAVCLVLLIVVAKGGQYYSSLKGRSDKLCVWLGFAFALIVLSVSSVICFIWGIISLWR